VKQQLQLRAHPLPPTVWSSDKQATLAADISSIIARHLGWPNSNFGPDDACAGLLAGTATGLEGICAFQEIAEKYSIRESDVTRLSEGSFGELIAYLHDRSIK
jgi:hypothetical protein